MKRLLALLAGGLGLRALLRRRRRSPLPDTHADDLRARLAESRAESRATSQTEPQPEPTPGAAAEDVVPLPGPATEHAAEPAVEPAAGAATGSRDEPGAIPAEPEPEVGVDERRAAVHDRARNAIGELREP